MTHFYKEVSGIFPIKAGSCVHWYIISVVQFTNLFKSPEIFSIWFNYTLRSYLKKIIKDTKTMSMQPYWL